MTTNTLNPTRTARDYTGKPLTMPVPHRGVLIGAYAEGIVELYRTGATFAVVYGLQMKQLLAYRDAAMEVGSCLLHVAQCEGKLD